MLICKETLLFMDYLTYKLQNDMYTGKLLTQRNCQPRENLTEQILDSQRENFDRRSLAKICHLSNVDFKVEREIKYSRAKITRNIS